MEDSVFIRETTDQGRSLFWYILRTVKKKLLSKFRITPAKTILAEFALSDVTP